MFFAFRCCIIAQNVVTLHREKKSPVPNSIARTKDWLEKKIENS